MGDDLRYERDFFVSYTHVDRGWAEWIAWMLEEDGYRVLIQAWDFVSGSNWVQGMQAGARDAARTVAVLSPDYLESVYGSAEWQAAWAQDPAGRERRLLVVRARECERPGLLAGVTGIDLFGLSEAEARERLRGMAVAAISGRAKPASMPGFPGGERAVQGEPEYPGTAGRGQPGTGWAASAADPLHRVGVYIAAGSLRNSGSILTSGPNSSINITSNDVVNTGIVSADEGGQGVRLADHARFIASCISKHTAEWEQRTAGPERDAAFAAGYVRFGYGRQAGELYDTAAGAGLATPLARTEFEGAATPWVARQVASELVRWADDLDYRRPPAAG